MRISTPADDATTACSIVASGEPLSPPSRPPNSANNPHITKSRPSSSSGAFEKLPTEPAEPMRGIIAELKAASPASFERSGRSLSSGRPTSGGLSLIEPERSSGILKPSPASQEIISFCRKTDAASQGGDQRPSHQAAGAERCVDSDKHETTVSSGDSLKATGAPFLTDLDQFSDAALDTDRSDLTPAQDGRARLVWSEDAGEYVENGLSRGTTPAASPPRTPQQVGQSLDAFLAHQEHLRNELEEYIGQLRTQVNEEGAPLVEFPEHFDDVVDLMQQDGHAPTHSGKISKWAKYLVGDEASDKELASEQKIAQGFRRMRQLDMVLLKKTRKSKKIREQGAAMSEPKRDMSNDDEDDDECTHRRSRVAMPTEADMRNAKPEARFFKLKPEEEERVERLLQEECEAYAGSGSGAEVDDRDRPSESDKPDTGYTMGTAEQTRLSEIDQALSRMDRSLVLDNGEADRPTSGDGEYSKKSRKETDWLREERIRREASQHLRQVENRLHRVRVQAWVDVNQQDQDAVQELLSTMPNEQQPSGEDRERVRALLLELQSNKSRQEVSSSALSVKEIHRCIREVPGVRDEQPKLLVCTQAEEVEDTNQPCATQGGDAASGSEVLSPAQRYKQSKSTPGD